MAGTEVARWALGWMLVLAVGALLTACGVIWFFVGPDMAIAASGLGFLTASGAAAQAIVYLGLAADVAVALLAARRST